MRIQEAYRSIVPLLAAGALAAGPLLADFSYEQTSNITGGMIAGMMRVAGVFSKQAREPIRNTVAVKGDRMATLSPQHASIIDLGKETITNIDFQKKTYSVMTFAEMKAAMEEAARKAQQKQKPGEEMNFKVEVTPTGKTKQIQGLDTKEIIVKMALEATGADRNKGDLVITMDSWLAPSAPGYDEVKNFHQRMAEKLAWLPGSGAMAMMNRPDISKGMAAAAKEMSKLDGMPVYQVTKMGGEGQPGAAPAAEQQQQAPPPQQQQAEKPSAGGVLGGAIGGRLGRFGGLGRKKEAPKQEEAPAQPAPAQQQQGRQGGDPSGALLEMTTEMSGFSSNPVDASKFEVPAGFKKVPAK